MSRLRTAYGVQRDCAIKSDKTPVMLDSQGKQVNVGDLLGSMHEIRIDQGAIQKADFVRPEAMIGRICAVSEHGKGLARTDRPWIGALRNDPDEAILSYGARCPNRIRLRHQPRFGPSVVNMSRVEEREEHVHVKEGDQRNSSSRSRSISSEVTITPRAGKGLNPRNSSSELSSDVLLDAASPFRANSDKTWPALLCSCLPSAFAAMSTSSAMSRVVRMHLMLPHHERRFR